MRIGELAAIAGVSPDTIRHYERRGLLPRAARTASGYREFSADSVTRLRTVRSALAIGFTVQELSQILGERERGGAPCRKVRALAASKLEHVLRQERELRALRRALIELLADWDARLAGKPDGKRAYLLDRLGKSADATPPSTNRRLRRTTKEKP